MSTSKSSSKSTIRKNTSKNDVSKTKKRWSTKDLKSKKSKSEYKLLQKNIPPSLKALLSKKVLEIAQPPEIIEEDTSIREIVKLLQKNKVLLVSKKYEVTGMITPLTTIKNLQNHEIEKIVASDIKEEVFRIDSSKSILDAISKMKENNTNFLVVISKEVVIGIVSSEEILDIVREFLSGPSLEKEEIIETPIDEFIKLLKKGPISIKEVKSKLGVDSSQIDEWITVLENQNVMKIEKRFGKLSIKKVKNE